MTQQVHSCCSNLCKKCNQTKPCAWLSLGNEYCDEIIIIDSLLCKLKYNNDNLQTRINKAIEVLKLCNSKCSKEVIDILRGEEDDN